MTRDITKLIEDLELNHEYCPKEVILQAAAELRGLQDRIHDIYVQLGEAESQMDQQYKMGMEAEREACAKVVEGYCGAWSDEGYALAAAIRARSQQ
jgi:hypothetical protein